MKWSNSLLMITKEYRFEAAHKLDFVPEGHPCRNLHGHSYGVGVTLGRNAGLKAGEPWLVDYHVLDALMKPMIAELDHCNLNDKVLVSTAERIATLIAERVADCVFSFGYHGVDFVIVTVSETAKTSASVRLDRRT